MAVHSTANLIKYAAAEFASDRTLGPDGYVDFAFVVNKPDSEQMTRIRATKSRCTKLYHPRAGVRLAD